MKERYFELYSITESTIGKKVRVFVFLFSLLFIYVSFAASLQLFLAVFALVLINELFLEHLSRMRPEKIVDNRADHFENSLTYPTRKKFNSGKTTYDVAKSLASEGSVKFFMVETGLLRLEVADIQKDELLEKAYALVSKVQGNYITEVDLFASYIFLSENTTHFLQNNKFDNDDVINVVYWARRQFAPDKFESSKTLLIGEGIFDSLCYGWNYELKKYAKDKTLDVLSRRDPPIIIGSEKEYKQLEVALSKHKTSNAIIIGEAGTGKTSLVEFLAYSSFLGNAPPELSHKKIYELFVDRLLSGVSTPGELATRLSGLLDEIAHSGNSLVFIQNIENIFGGGGLAYDISGVLPEYLSSDRVKIIGTTTPAGFANFIKAKTSAANLFEKIEISPLDTSKTLLILTDRAQEVAGKYGVRIKYNALKQSAVLAPLYFPDRFLPGAAIELLENVGARAKIDKKKIIDGADVIALVQSKTNVAIAEPTHDEKELLLHLEEKLHSRVIGQEEAINTVAAAIRRLRSGFKNGEKPISVLLFLGPTGVGKTETAKALAREYFGNENAMIRLDMSEYQTQEQIKRLLGAHTGEEYVPNTLTELVVRQPFSLVLLDEFEKAHPQILDLFLQVFDEGRLTDNQGKTASFKNTIIIATSNAGTELIRETEASGASISKDELINYLLTNNLFRPELVNRFDGVIMFRFLNQEEVKKIGGILLGEQLAKLAENQIKISFDDSVLEKIAKEAYNPEFGARQIRRYIENNIEEFLSKKILSDEIKNGDQVALSVDESGNFVVT